MHIEYLKELEKNAYYFGNPNKKNKPISETEIAHLEQLYNDGKSFPKALTELLYLAGDYCYVFDYGLNESQEELQEFVRENLFEYEKALARPFFVIDVYNAGDQFLFVYLDAGDDPAVYQATYYFEQSDWIKEIKPHLSELVERLIERVKEGISPF